MTEYSPTSMLRKALNEKRLADKNEEKNHASQTIGQIKPKKIALHKHETRSEAERDSPYFLDHSLHLIQAVQILSASWKGFKDEVNFTKFHTQGIPTPEELNACAEEADVDLLYFQKSLKQITQEYCPCILMLKSGQSLIVSRRINEGTFEININNQGHALSHSELSAYYSGTVFLIRPKTISQRQQENHDESNANLKAKKEAPTQENLNRFQATYQLFRFILKQAAHQQSKPMMQLLLASFISNVLMLALPLFTMSVYDRVIPHLAMETLWALAIGVLIALSCDLSLRTVKTKFLDAIGLNATLSLQARLYRRLVDIQMAFAPRTSGGLMRIVRDVEMLGQAVPSLFVSLVIDLPFFFILLIMLASIGGWVVLAPLMGVMILVIVHCVSYMNARRANLDLAQLIQKQSNQIHETIESLETIKATTSERLFLRKWELMGDETSFSGHTARIWNGITLHSSAIITQCIIASVLIIGVYQISASAMTIGALAASTLLVGRSISPINQLLNLSFRAMHLSDTAEGLLQLLNAPLEARGDRSLRRSDDLKGKISFNNVTFTYQGAPAPSLYNINLTIEPGERVGVIGRVGSGKSTLLRLLLRLQESSEGSIMLDGKDIRQYAPKTLRRSFSFMQQESVLFEGTLRENILFGLDTMDEEAFNEALKISGVEKIIAQHPEGAHMHVGPRGERLSGGERQTVALARTLISKPKVLILDEPTSSMDNTLEAQFMSDLEPFLEGRSLIISTHRAQLLKLVDRVIWMDQGRIIMDGPKAEIMAKISGEAA